VYESVFKVGDMIIDKLTNEVGLLIERYDVFDGYFSTEELENENIGPIWAWEILWTGHLAAATKYNRYGSYTEIGLISLIRDEALELIRADSENGS